jgi:hypothetical protein
MTSIWLEVPALVAVNNATVLDSIGAGTPSTEFSRILQESPDKGLEICAIRLTLVVEDPPSTISSLF